VISEHGESLRDRLVCLDVCDPDVITKIELS
jgi:hypothetical protein